VMNKIWKIGCLIAVLVVVGSGLVVFLSQTQKDRVSSEDINSISMPKHVFLFKAILSFPNPPLLNQTAGLTVTISPIGGVTADTVSNVETRLLLPNGVEIVSGNVRQEYNHIVTNETIQHKAQLRIKDEGSYKIGVFIKCLTPEGRTHSETHYIYLAVSKVSSHVSRYPFEKTTPSSREEAINSTKAKAICIDKNKLKESEISNKASTEVWLS